MGRGLTQRCHYGFADRQPLGFSFKLLEFYFSLSEWE